MSFDPYAPYGPLVESVVRVATWNVWGRYGSDWEARQAALEDALAEVRPDVICLTESWRCGESNQPRRIAEQLSQLVHFIEEVASRRDPVIVCGDFNAGPDSDEIRMLTGRSAVARPGVVFYDSWELARDGSPGCTWSNGNPLAAVGLYPDRRFDYVFSAWPRRGGVGDI
ncbi:MAG: endonuclease/exonuclease/phosphatase family protein [Streptosporangiaceae bacterium]